MPPIVWHRRSRRRSPMAKPDSARTPEFKGRLGIGEHEIPISFKAHVDDTGKLVFALEEIPLNNDTVFIMHAWRRPDDRLAYFRLTGEAEGNVTLATEHLCFNSIGPQSDRKRGSYYVFGPHCEDATIRQEPAKRSNEPALILRLRGF